MFNTFFTGRLGGDAEQKSFRNGNGFVAFRVCTDRYDAEKKARVGDWANVTYPGDAALKLLPYLKKGTLVEVIGTLTTSAYRTRDGGVASSVDIYASKVGLMGGGRPSGETSDNADCGSFTKKDEPQNTAPEHPAVANSAAPTFPPPQDDDDNDLPF